jgi:uncharacterized SAM-binding protein YcdF (DUF218 family)
MFFVVSKALGFFAMPSNVLMLFCLGGAMLSLTRFWQVGFRLCVAGVLLLAFFGYSPAGHLLLLSLEQRFPPWTAIGGEPNGVIVLGGGLAADRLIAAASLSREYPNIRIVSSGGTGELFPSGETEAELAARVLERLGVSRSRIVLENKSRNTAENARYSKALINPLPKERWLLVTSALNMPRAVGVFRHAHFPVEPYPVGWIAGSLQDIRRPMLVASSGLAATDAGIHEWIGLAAYWLSGRTAELFPSP